MRNCSWLMAAVLVSASPGKAAEGSFSSGPAHVALLELYTSEGCSSCPPAEDWLGQRKDEPDLWKRYVPISFHVTYWDNLGWKDELAQPPFTARQRHYARQWGSGSVYTPCFVRDGAEWQISNTRQPEGETSGTLTLRSLPSGEWELSFVPQAGNKGEFDGHVSLLGRGIISKVRAGENRGRTLAHDFVALELKDAPLKRGTTEGARSAVVSLDAPPFVAESRAVAAWVTRRGEVDPIQATGGDLK